MILGLSFDVLLSNYDDKRRSITEVELRISSLEC